MLNYCFNIKLFFSSSLSLHSKALFPDSSHHNFTLSGLMSALGDCGRLSSSVQLGFALFPTTFRWDDKPVSSAGSFPAFTTSDFILIPFSDFSLLKHNTLMTLLSESHTARSEFNISEIRQQAGPVILGRLALRRLMEWGEEGSGRSCHSPAVPAFLKN